jgi:CRP/FNR family cyclic AMP-dependent transcriptional regulator
MYGRSAEGQECWDMAGFLNLFQGETGAVKLAPGQVLFSKGDPAKHLYVVQKGEVDIVDGDHVLETLKEGEIFGEMGLVDGGLRTAGARARTQGVVIAVDEKRFLKMVSDTPFFALRVMRVMSSRLRVMNERAAGH